MSTPRNQPRRPESTPSRRVHQPITPPERLGDVLGRLFAARGWGRKQERLKLDRAWAAAAPEFLTQTRVLALKRGVLEVLVGNAVLMGELASFHKRRLLTALKGQLPGVVLSDVKFRAGVL